MTDFCFLSVAFGPRYIEQQKRLDASLERIHPDAEHVMWTNNYPPGSRTHKESLYGFKPHAVAALLDAGYKKIIWLDTAIVLQHPVDYWFTLGVPVIAAKDDNALGKTICDKALNYYSNPNIENMNLVGGSVYVFDFNQTITHRIFNRWLGAEMDGIFGSQEEQSAGLINRHRHDEAALAYLMQSNGVQPMAHDVMRYNQDENSIVRKYHFK
jgi:hypothetical protein